MEIQNSVRFKNDLFGFLLSSRRVLREYTDFYDNGEKNNVKIPNVSYVGFLCTY